MSGMNGADGRVDVLIVGAGPAGLAKLRFVVHALNSTRVLRAPGIRRGIMRRIALRRVAVSGAAVGVLAGGVWYAAPAQAGGQADVRKDVAAVRAATAQYHHEAKAVADGFALTDECVSSPAGAMGFHYVNFERFGAPLDVARPAALIYQPSPSGERKLVAVEYFKVDEDQDLATDDDRPSLFGEPFDGPMPGHAPGMPIHYDLHAWVWQHNPTGMFEEWNPAGYC